MLEKLPEKPLEKTEDHDGKERPPRHRTIEHEILETHADGSKTERVLECNGQLHRRCIDKIWYGENDEIIFTDQLSQEELGACDGAHE